MPILDILYKIGDKVGDLLAQCEDRVTAESWRGYWVSLATQAVTVPKEEHDRVADNMVAALRIAFAAVRDAQSRVGG